MTDKLDLPLRYREQLEALLRNYVPEAEVWAYGSRIRNRSHAGSDLDLVLRGPGLERLGDGYYDLLDAIEQSNIPILIQVHDWARLPESFHREIERNYVVVQEQAKQTPSEEWREVFVSEVASARIGGTPSRAVAEYWQGNVPWATAKDVANSGSRYLDKVEESISEIGLAESAAKLMPEGTVIITARGTVGALAQLRREMAFNQTCYALVPTDEIDNDFLFYALKGTLTTMETLTYGTVFQTITRKSFNEWRLPLPPLPEQRAIVHVLGTLDDKIELNRRINDTLEAMARTIFKSWFIDFDPVRAKIEGRDTGLPKHLADLFPDRFVDSEIGEIPAGWKVKMLEELLELAYGKALKADDRKKGAIPVYGSNGQIGWHDKKLVTGPGIIVGRKGNPGVVKYSQNDFFPIDTAFYVVPRDRNLRMIFLFFALANQNLPSVSADSAVPGLNRNLAYMNSQLVPDKMIMEQFSNFASTIFLHRHQLKQESFTLATLRDQLLPKLISGGLRVI